MDCGIESEQTANAMLPGREVHAGHRLYGHITDTGVPKRREGAPPTVGRPQPCRSSGPARLRPKEGPSCPRTLGAAGFLSHPVLQREIQHEVIK